MEIKPISYISIHAVMFIVCCSTIQSNVYGLEMSESETTIMENETRQMSPQQQLWAACTNGDITQAKELLAQGVSFLGEDQNNDTIIHVMAKKLNSPDTSLDGSEKIKELFIQMLRKFPKKKNYCVLRMRNGDGKTPLHILMAGRYAHTDIVSVCLEYDPICARIPNSVGKYPDECVTSIDESFKQLQIQVRTVRYVQNP